MNVTSPLNDTLTNNDSKNNTGWAKKKKKHNTMLQVKQWRATVTVLL